MQGHSSQLFLLRKIPARCQPQVHTVTHVAKYIFKLTHGLKLSSCSISSPCLQHLIKPCMLQHQELCLLAQQSPNPPPAIPTLLPANLSVCHQHGNSPSTSCPSLFLWLLTKCQVYGTRNNSPKPRRDLTLTTGVCFKCCLQFTQAIPASYL